MGRQPERIAGMVVRAKSVELSAVVAMACRILGRFFTSDVPVCMAAQPWAKDVMQELVSHTISLWLPWGDVAGSCANTWETFAGKPPAWPPLPPDPAT